MTDERAHRPEDVARARAAVHNAEVTFGPRTRRRSVGDTWRDFAHRYGWRAYALPILVVLTVAALMTTTQTPSGGGHNPPAVAEQGPQQAGGAPPPVASGSFSLKRDDASASGPINDNVLKTGALPAGPPYTAKGDGTFKLLKGTSPKVGTGHLYRYSIEVENGITGVDIGQFQKLVVSTLADPRSWSGHGVALQRVDSGPIDFRVTLTSSMTTRKFCGYDIPVETSCYDGTNHRVVLNVSRWMRGSAAYVGDLDAYRIYMINHEDGHALGHQHAHQCLPGGLAPVMMQQTFGLKSAATGKLCGANPWPYPPGAKGAPGAEQADTDKNGEFGLN
jgi:hypothetical protein